MFSTNIVSLLDEKIFSDSPEINVSKIFTYLSRNDFGLPYTNSTHFRDIKSVLPGSLISIGNSEFITNSYLSPLRSNWGELKDEQSYGNIFRDLFFKSVRQGMINKRRIGAQLSGGLDSSSVCSALRSLSPNLNLHTFYTETNTSLSDEASYAKVVAKNIYSQHNIITPSYKAIDDLVFATQIFGQPVYGSMGTSLLVNLYRKANEIGCDSLFTGHDGDSIVGHGTEYLDELMNHKEWENLRSALSEVATLEKYSMIYGKSWHSYSQNHRNELIFTRFIYRQLLSFVKQGKYFESGDLLIAAQKYFDIRPYSLLHSGAMALFNKLRTKNEKTKFIQDKSFSKRYHAFNTETDSYIENTHNSITYNQNIRVIEEQASLGEYFNIEVIHPFFDKDIYEFCKSVPSSVLFHKGMGRGPLRMAMKDILPEIVRTRTTKGIYNDYVKSDTILLLGQSQDFLVDTSTVWDYVDKSKFRLCVKMLTQKINSIEVESSMIFFISKTIFLAVWLQVFRNNTPKINWKPII